MTTMLACAGTKAMQTNQLTFCVANPSTQGSNRTSIISKVCLCSMLALHAHESWQSQLSANKMWFTLIARARKPWGDTLQLQHICTSVRIAGCQGFVLSERPWQAVLCSPHRLVSVQRRQPGICRCYLCETRHV